MSEGWQIGISTRYVPLQSEVQSEVLVTRDDATTQRVARARPASRGSNMLLSVDATFAQHARVPAPMDA